MGNYHVNNLLYDKKEYNEDPELSTGANGNPEQASKFTKKYLIFC